MLWIKGTYKSTARTAPWRIAGKIDLTPPIGFQSPNIENLPYLILKISFICKGCNLKLQELMYSESDSIPTLQPKAGTSHQQWLWLTPWKATQSPETVRPDFSALTLRCKHRSLCQSSSSAVQNVWEQSSLKHELIILCCQSLQPSGLTTTAIKWSYNPCISHVMGYQSPLRHHQKCNWIAKNECSSHGTNSHSLVPSPRQSCARHSPIMLGTHPGQAGKSHPTSSPLHWRRCFC